VALIDEILRKILCHNVCCLCHNVCCLIQSTYELGIVTDFWGKEAIGGRAEHTPILEAAPHQGMGLSLTTKARISTRCIGAFKIQIYPICGAIVPRIPSQDVKTNNKER
jgi:hypothetical protein